jgi:hypothetical protein
MKKKNLESGLLIDDFMPLLTVLKKEQSIIPEEEDPGVDYAAEYKKQTGRDLETGEYVTQ